MPVFKAVNKNFFKKWSSEMAYILGFFAADGYITVNKRGGQFWCIQITDEGLLCEIKEAIRSEHKISCKKGKGNEKNLYRIQIGSIEMCDDLRKIGFHEKKTNNLTIPNIPPRFFNDFVRGYFDGDGNVWAGYHNKHRKTPTHNLITVFTSCSTSFLKDMKGRLDLNGLKNGSIYTSKKNYSRLQYSTKDSLKIYDFMYNSLGESRLFLNRKKLVFEKFMKMRS